MNDQQRQRDELDDFLDAAEQQAPPAGVAPGSFVPGSEGALSELYTRTRGSINEGNAGREITIDPNGRPRQAGADCQEGRAIERFRKLAERSLYAFTKGILRRDYLTKNLHAPVCDWLATIPPFRKLLLLPREHAKTTIISHGLPPHILIQPAESNIYFKNQAGSEQRILLCGETQMRAVGNLRVVRDGVFTDNELFRALWPHVCWTNPRRQAGAWNNYEIIIPRENEWPDPSIRAIGVDGAITGARPTVEIKDDLISVKAANSELEMQNAINWHVASRALLEEYEADSGQEGLELLLGTRWAVYDLYQYIIDEDPTVEILTRAIVEDGEPLWPERHTLESVEKKKKEYGALFWLLYMNSPHNPELTDFAPGDLRYFALNNGIIELEEDERDIVLRNEQRETGGDAKVGELAKRGETMRDLFDRLRQRDGRAEYFRLKTR